MSLAITENTLKTTIKESYTNTTPELNDNYKAIETRFLKLSSKSSVSNEDKLLIAESLELVNDAATIISLMEDCYKQKKSFANTASASDERGLGNGIWSFKYFLNYIKKELGSEDEYAGEIVFRDEVSTSGGISDESDGEALHIGWLDDTKCDF